MGGQSIELLVSRGLSTVTARGRTRPGATHGDLGRKVGKAERAVHGGGEEGWESEGGSNLG